jgi:hypothetical protein
VVLFGPVDTHEEHGSSSNPADGVPEESHGGLMEQCSGHDISQAINPPAHRAGHGLPEWLAGLDPPGAHRSAGRKGRYPVQVGASAPIRIRRCYTALPELPMAKGSGMRPKAMSTPRVPGAAALREERDVAAQLV